MTSIIIPIRFRPDLVKVCLDSLFANTKDFEFIVVQDGKDDEMKKLLKNYKIDHLIYHEEAQGYVKAINAGYKKATGDYVMFLNEDTVCTPGWLDKMVKVFEDKKVGIVAPTLTMYEGLQSIENNPKRDKLDDVDMVMGACILMKKSLCEKLLIGEDILDTRFGMGGGDDNDLCMRVKQAGYKVIINRDVFIYHYISASFRKLFNDDVDYSKKYASEKFMQFQDKFKKELGHKPKIFIAIPTGNGMIDAELGIRLVEWSHNPAFDIHIEIIKGLSPLDNARNNAVKKFLEDYYDYLLFIDNDIVPPPNSLMELIGADKNIIAPLCFTINIGDDGLPFPQPVAHRYDEKGEYRPYVGKGIEETDIVTGGMFLVKRGVYEKMERPFAFTYHKNGTVIYSEDFYFSRQAKELGYKLYTHFGLMCKHFKQIDALGLNNLMVKYCK